MDQHSVPLKEYLTEILEREIKIVNGELEAIRRELVLGDTNKTSALALERERIEKRLEELNSAHARAKELEALIVTRSQWEQGTNDLNRRINVLELDKARAEGRVTISTITSIIAALIAAGGLILAFVNSTRIS